MDGAPQFTRDAASRVPAHRRGPRGDRTRRLDRARSCCAWSARAITSPTNPRRRRTSRISPGRPPRAGAVFAAALPRADVRPAARGADRPESGRRARAAPDDGRRRFLGLGRRGRAPITWAVGSTFYRLPLARRARRGAPARWRVRRAADAERFDAPRRGAARHAGRQLGAARATVITMRGDEVLANADLVVQRQPDRRASARAARVACRRARTVVDASGKYVVPGLIDAHDHVGGIRRNVLQFDDWSLRATARLRRHLGARSVVAVDRHVRLRGPDRRGAGRRAAALHDRHGDVLVQPAARHSTTRATSCAATREHYRTRNLKQYRIGSRRERQWIAMAAQEQRLMPTTRRRAST